MTPDTKKLICPCCNEEIEIPTGKYSKGFDCNYSTLINSTEEFFDLVDICPKCGYVMLFDNGIDDSMREFVRSDTYKNILNSNTEENLKKWILYAILAESDENYTEAGIAYMKAYDYMELKGMPKDQKLIEKAATCFLSSVESLPSQPPFIDSILAVDCMRRDNDMERATNFLNAMHDTFEGELAEELIQKESSWIKYGETEKKFLKI